MTTEPGGLLAVGSSAPVCEPGAGLSIVRYDATGALSLRGVRPLDHPSYTASDPVRGVLHAVLERDAGRVVSFRFHPRTGLRTPRAVATSGGALPCHLSVHPSGSHVFAAHYGDGVLSVFRTAADGTIAVTEPVQTVRHPGPAPLDGRLTPAHAHMAAPSPDGRFVLCTTLGTDRVHVYGFDPLTGRLTEHRSVPLPPGRGPRHLVFHPSGRYVHVVNELSSTLTVCTWDASTGHLEPVAELSTRPDPSAPGANYPAAVRISADGRFLYTSNRGDDTIAVHAVHDHGASLALLTTVASGGSWPRDLALSPDQRLLFCANQRSDALAAFHRDPSSGHLTPAGQPLSLTAPTSVLPIGGASGAGWDRPAG
ncbi:lactonase family protein [Streptomyces sp. NRRL WC-3742]|uniref:lactonase family protein n=1 Tax=Streptomyces sp. NRRL WC-3742 TaxID=1463934 RepID=UPI0007C43199|nr:lactonase family protein [Streptomyces sp. NRRL WC-3742]